MQELNDWDEAPEPEFDLQIRRYSAGRFKEEKQERAEIIGQILSLISKNRSPIEELRIIKSFLELRETMSRG